jgi:hypothetical protein
MYVERCKSQWMIILTKTTARLPTVGTTQRHRREQQSR